MNIVDRVLNGSSEKRVMDRGKKIIDHATNANKMLIKTINGSNAVEEVRAIEKLSDMEVFDISNAITSGAIAPNLIDDMIRFVDMEDTIVDTIFNLSRAFVRYRGRNKKVDAYVKKNLLELSALTNKALAHLYEMHKAETIEEAKKIRESIELVEQRGDEIKDAMLDYVYKSRDVDFRAFYYIQDLAYLSDNILDGCEDTSDMILSIMRSILT